MAGTWRGEDERAVPAVYVVTPGGLDAAGGIGRLVSATIRYWRAAGMRPALRVIDPYGPARLAATPFYFGRAIAQILWNARYGRIALLHIHMAGRGSMLRKGIIVRLASWLRLPVILHLHGSRLDEIYVRLPRWAQQLVRRTIGRADCVIVVGEYWRRVLLDTLGIDARLIQVVSNAVAGPSEVAPRQHGAPCRLLFVGKLTPVKGFPELLDALASDQLRELPWQLQAAGEGDARLYAERLEKLGLAARVELCGWVPEARVHELLEQADVFVLPSHNEGLSMAMLEAMAHGCAVVTTPAGATLDVVADGVSALVVPTGNREQLAKALRRVVEDQPLRMALQAAARRRFCEAFEIASHCQRLADLYRDVGAARREQQH